MLTVYQNLLHIIITLEEWSVSEVNILKSILGFSLTVIIRHPEQSNCGNWRQKSKTEFGISHHAYNALAAPRFSNLAKILSNTEILIYLSVITQTEHCWEIRFSRQL